MYLVKEIFYTLQGEGVHTGRPAVFLRFAGCNLWNGLESHRASAICKFCDTDFVGLDGLHGGKYDAEGLVGVIRSLWPDPEIPIYLVCTGGEPALQMDQALVDAFHREGIIIAIETNGTLPLPEGIDWVCVSPKSDTALAITRGNELKLVYPQEEALPERFEFLDFDHFSLQPMDGPLQKINTAKCLEYCRNHPKWKLSLQTHKILEIP
ncbi:MAG TPA: 7-carboxy-7-deazaguanine synthase [Saprospiraceae bacterium]|nr:7-carboxy-7-deazaguanine synthase [Saprospiraceae bacterium]HNT21605.1 7-carboxy-7-deazaguanine synthase [Saprospiraceae bacterium]